MKRNEKKRTAVTKCLNNYLITIIITRLMTILRVKSQCRYRQRFIITLIINFYYYIIIIITIIIIID